MNLPNEHVFSLIEKELERQIKKFGEQNHHPLEWSVILGEEVGEVNRAIVESHFNNVPWDNYLEELVQVAAVSVAMIKCYHKNHWKEYKLNKKDIL